MLGPSAFRNATSYVEFDCWIKRPLTLRQKARERNYLNLDSYHLNYQTFRFLPFPPLDGYVKKLTADIFTNGWGFDYPSVMLFFNTAEQDYAEHAVFYDSIGRSMLAISQRIYSRFHRDTGILFEKIVMEMGPHNAKRRALIESDLGSLLDDSMIKHIMYLYLISV